MRMTRDDIQKGKANVGTNAEPILREIARTSISGLPWNLYSISPIRRSGRGDAMNIAPTIRQLLDDKVVLVYLMC